MQRKRRAFTLIEILVVLGIIAALAAMLFLGFRHVSRNSRANLTHVTLQNLRSMMTEYTTSGGSVDRLEAGYTPSLTITAPAGSVIEGDENAGVGLRYNSPEIDQTRFVMNQLLAVPSNQKVLESLPADHIWRTAKGVVLLDGDRNPIIFVPRRGMKGVNLGTTGKDTYSNTNQTIFSPGAKLISAGPPQVMEGQPFFASSGEDADFSKGDDNHYSFQQ